MKNVGLIILGFAILVLGSCGAEDQPSSFGVKIDGELVESRPYGHWDDYGVECWQAGLILGEGCTPTHKLLVFAISDGQNSNGWFNDYSYLMVSFLYVPDDEDWDNSYEINTYEYWGDLNWNQGVSLENRFFGFFNLYIGNENYTTMNTTGKIKISTDPGPVITFEYDLDVENLVNNDGENTVLTKHHISGKSRGSFYYQPLNVPFN